VGLRKTRDKGAYSSVPRKIIIWYKCLTFVPDGLEMASTRPCEGAFALGSGSTRYKCHYLYQGQKILTSTNKKWVGDKCPIL
jgi:hypothetical protein